MLSFFADVYLSFELVVIDQKLLLNAKCIKLKVQSYQKYLKTAVLFKELFF